MWGIGAEAVSFPLPKIMRPVVSPQAAGQSHAGRPYSSLLAAFTCRYGTVEEYGRGQYLQLSQLLTCRSRTVQYRRKQTAGIHTVEAAKRSIGDRPTDLLPSSPAMEETGVCGGNESELQVLWPEYLPIQ